MLRVLLVILAMPILASCQSISPLYSQEPLDKVALAFIHMHEPTWTIPDYPKVIIDRDDSWEWTFEMPSGRLGGVPSVFISKQTGEVVDAIHGQ